MTLEHLVGAQIRVEHMIFDKDTVLQIRFTSGGTSVPRFVLPGFLGPLLDVVLGLAHNKAKTGHWQAQPLQKLVNSYVVKRHASQSSRKSLGT